MEKELRTAAGTPGNADGSFEAEFRSRLDNIIKRGNAVGLSVSKLCKLTGIARATPDRWRKKAPLSVTLVDKFEAEVAAAEREVAANK